MTQHFNRSKEKKKRRSLRKNATEAEKKLWRYLKGKNLAGIKFRRQYSVDSYILDFYAPGLKLAIELDGEMHYTPDAKAYDRRRTKHLAKFGIEVIRFTNYEVFENIEGVLWKIEETIKRIQGSG